MTAGNLIDSVVGPTSAYGHCEFGSLERELVSAMSDDWPC